MPQPPRRKTTPESDRLSESECAICSFAICDFPMTPIRVGILTLSDRCSRGQAEDTSGPGLAAICREKLHAEVVFQAILPDDADQISSALLEMAKPEHSLDLILTTG